MIITFSTPTGLHAIKVIQQKGLTQIEAVGLCDTKADGGAGIFQVADWAFDGRPKYGTVTVCPKCVAIVTKYAKVPPS